MKNRIGFFEVGQENCAALLDPGKQCGIAALRCQVTSLHHQGAELVRVSRLSLQLGQVRQQTRFQRLQLRNGGPCILQQRLRLPGPILGQQDFGFQELKLERARRATGFRGKPDAIVCVSQCLSKVAASPCQIGAPVDSVSRPLAQEAAAGRQANSDQKPRRPQVVPFPPTPPPPPLPGFFSCSLTSCIHCAVLAGM